MNYTFEHYYLFLFFMLFLWIIAPLGLIFLIRWAISEKNPFNSVSPSTDHLAHCRKCDALVDYHVVTECPYCAAKAYRLHSLDPNK